MPMQQSIGTSLLETNILHTHICVCKTHNIYILIYIHIYINVMCVSVNL